MMLVQHDDATREYAYGPANDLPDTHVGTFPEALAKQAKENCPISKLLTATITLDATLLS